MVTASVRWFSSVAATSSGVNKIWLRKERSFSEWNGRTYLGDAGMSLTWEEAAGLHAELGRRLAQKHLTKE